MPTNLNPYTYTHYSRRKKEKKDQRKYQKYKSSQPTCTTASKNSGKIDVYKFSAARASETITFSLNSLELYILSASVTQKNTDAASMAQKTKRVWSSR